MVLAGAGVAAAEPAPPFAALWRQAEDAAPRLRESVALVQAAHGMAAQAATLPNPTLGVETENLGVADHSAIAPPQTTVSLSQPIELGGKRAARIASGRAEIGAAQARPVQTRADFAHDLAMAYAEAEAADARAVILTADLDRASEDLRAAEAMVRAGKEADVRGVQARAARSAADADLGAARADSEAALAKLSSLAGVHTPFTSLGGSLLQGAAALSSPVMPRDDAPAVLVARAERDAAARKVEVERSRAAPDLTVTAGARRIDGLSGTAAVVGVSIPFPLFDRNKGATAAASSQLNAAEARLRAAELDAEGDWRAAAAQARSASGRLSAAEEGAEAADESYGLSRTGYEGGKLSLTDLLTARRAANEAALRLLDARLARVRAEIELARVAGRVPFGG
jgi:cobalt-zinc-cadmium efflux system outer membrane protein